MEHKNDKIKSNISQTSQICELMIFQDFFSSQTTRLSESFNFFAFKFCMKKKRRRITECDAVVEKLCSIKNEDTPSGKNLLTTQPVL